MGGCGEREGHDTAKSVPVPRKHTRRHLRKERGLVDESKDGNGWRTHRL
jgi:hypothetical protein